MSEKNLDIGRTRRLAIIVALILITYSAAGIEIAAGGNIQILGVGFIVTRPDLLPIGLLIASIYLMVSYFYYAVMLLDSPYRRRRNILDQMTVTEPKYTSGRNVKMYFGSSKFETSNQYHHHEAKSNAEAIKSSFPKILNKTCSYQIKSEDFMLPDGEDCTNYHAVIEIPVVCRIAALFQDLDYVSPIWLNLFAVFMNLRG